MFKALSNAVRDKRRWRAYRARVDALPVDYRDAVNSIQRYLMYLGGRGDGPGWASMLEDLAELFEQAAADRTPIRAVVGKDPAQFVDDFLQNYPFGTWVSRERTRLSDGIARAAGEVDGTSGVGQ